MSTGGGWWWLNATKLILIPVAVGLAYTLFVDSAVVATSNYTAAMSVLFRRLWTSKPGALSLIRPFRSKEGQNGAKRRRLLPATSALLALSWLTGTTYGKSGEDSRGDVKIRADIGVYCEAKGKQASAIFPPLQHSVVRSLMALVSASAVPKEHAHEGNVLMSLKAALSESVVSISHDVAPCDCGEDSFVVVHKPNPHSHGPSQDLVLMAVADGVGSWRKRGIDPGRFSRGLCTYLQSVFLKADDKGDLSLRRMVKRAFARFIADSESDVTAEQAGRPYGSSTLIAALLDPAKRTLDVVNIGDSGLMLLRPVRGDPGDKENGSQVSKGNEESVSKESGTQIVVQFRTPVQQSKFNAPLQLYYGPDNKIKDVSDRAFEQRLSLAPGDVVILASDGVYDNVSEEEIVSLVSSGSGDASARTLAERIARVAKLHAHNVDKASPFEQEAARHGLAHKGGKPDDITVVVCLVS